MPPWTRIICIVLLVVLAGSLLPGVVQSTPASPDAPGGELIGDDATQAEFSPDVKEADDRYDVQKVGNKNDAGDIESDDDHEGDEADDEHGEEEDDDHGDEEDDEHEGARVLGDWWGLGEEAAEAPYVGLAELGVGVLVVGLFGYSIGKRSPLVPLKYRRRLLQGHELTMLAGTALVVPHFVAVEEWEGLGLLVGLLLAIEVLSGLYGRHLHRHVIRLGRGDERPPILGRFLEVTTRRVLTRWRRTHILLTAVTAVALALHIVTAVGD